MLGTTISRPVIPAGIAFMPASRTPSSLRIRAAVAEAPAVESLRKPGNLYEVLRVKKNATAAEIKSAYRNLAKVYHPDVAAATKHHPEESFDGCDFIEIRKAYSTLSDPSSRSVYDLTLSIGGGVGVSQRRRAAGIRNDGDGVSGFRNRSGFYTTRRWETDQCW